MEFSESLLHRLYSESCQEFSFSSNCEFSFLWCYFFHVLAFDLWSLHLLPSKRQCPGSTLWLSSPIHQRLLNYRSSRGGVPFSGIWGQGRAESQSSLWSLPPYFFSSSLSLRVIFHCLLILWWTLCLVFQYP